MSVLSMEQHMSQRPIELLHMGEAQGDGPVKVGDVFESALAAKMHAAAWAEKHGFLVRQRNHQLIVCHLEGKPNKKQHLEDASKQRRERKSQRCGCEWSFRLTTIKKPDGGKAVAVTRTNFIHTNGCVPGQQQLKRGEAARGKRQVTMEELTAVSDRVSRMALEKNQGAPVLQFLRVLAESLENGLQPDGHVLADLSMAMFVPQDPTMRMNVGAHNALQMMDPGRSVLPDLAHHASASLHHPPVPLYPPHHPAHFTHVGDPAALP